MMLMFQQTRLKRLLKGRKSMSIILHEPVDTLPSAHTGGRGVINHARTGKMFLVGAGPGDPELITLKGLRSLHKADVIVYDRLICSDLLYEAPSQAERGFVGKASGHHSMEP